MRKGPGNFYGNWTQIFHNVQPSHGGDGKIFEVMIGDVPKVFLRDNYLMAPDTNRM